MYITNEAKCTEDDAHQTLKQILNCFDINALASSSNYGLIYLQFDTKDNYV